VGAVAAAWPPAWMLDAVPTADRNTTAGRAAPAQQLMLALHGHIPLPQRTHRTPAMCIQRATIYSFTSFSSRWQLLPHFPSNKQRPVSVLSSPYWLRLFVDYHLGGGEAHSHPPSRQASCKDAWRATPPPPLLLLLLLLASGWLAVGWNSCCNW
jgi:hypothetical protein